MMAEDAALSRLRLDKKSSDKILCRVLGRDAWTTPSKDSRQN
jgi:hypothetical protein